MPISNLNHCAARQVGTAHISGVRVKPKKKRSRDVFLQNLTAQKKEDNEILLNQIFQ